MYWLDVTQNYTGYPLIRNFFCDEPSDIANLPTSTTEGVQQGSDTVSCQKVNAGSSCLCIGSGELYMLNSSDTWVSV